MHDYILFALGWFERAITHHDAKEVYSACLAFSYWYHRANREQVPNLDLLTGHAEIVTDFFHHLNENGAVYG